MDGFINGKPHRRYNALTGEWILVSPHRTKRPWQGKQEKNASNVLPSYDAECYLCPSNTRASGVKNENYESTYSFVNDYASLLMDGGEEEYNEGLLQAKKEQGICKVVCFSPNHSLTLPLMEVDAIAEVIRLWQKEYKELGSIPEINHVQIFENKGEIMGCSNPHPHGQIWAQSTIPEEPRKKAEQQRLHFERHGSTLLSDYVQQELEKAERIIVENSDFVVLVPFWATWPFETMIVPKKPHQNIVTMSENEVVSFAEILSVLTIKYDNLFETSFPYSAGIHQAPTDGADHPEWHFHMSFYPPLLRSATVKKFMVGYEMFANPQRDITAENAAKTLKALGEIHYSKKSQQ
ncbi:UDP-glucose--hexose-1-phosphate uridylyltransferase [Flagellimonas sp.]|uniref:UDP-glucose--hexose-1-phosphate uridylyltransferase n=1 Tax=Flagellimonas sp. TaxID=2058762 RepID=UPI003F4A817F